MQIVKDIVRSKKVIKIARNFEAISNPAEPNINISKPQLSDENVSNNSLNQIKTKEVQVKIVPNDTFALSRGGTELKQSSTDKTIPHDSLNQTEVKEQGGNSADSNNESTQTTQKRRK